MSTFRTDVESHDVSDLYTFDDRTGILERHKQMLSQPFQEGQVGLMTFLWDWSRISISI